MTVTVHSFSLSFGLVLHLGVVISADDIDPYYGSSRSAPKLASNDSWSRLMEELLDGEPKSIARLMRDPVLAEMGKPLSNMCWWHR